MKLPRQSKLQRHLLELLEKQGPISTQQEIAEELDTSQSSISRSIRKLIDEGWVEKGDEGYKIAEKGSSVKPPVPANLLNELASVGNFNKQIVDALRPVFIQREELLNQWRPIIKDFQKSIGMEKADQLAKTIGEAYLNVANFSAFEQMLGQQQENLNQTLSQLVPHVQQWQQTLNRGSALLQQSIPKIPKIVEALGEDWSEEIQKANDKLIPYGWVFTPAMSIRIPKTVNDLEDEKDIEEIIDLLVEERFTKEECRKILDDVLDHPLFKKRSAPLEEAFDSHKEGRYYVSVPTFLAQMEGAYIEAFDDEYYLFKKKEISELPGNYPARDAMVDGLNSLMIEQLAEHSNKIEEPLFNRNLVMHGNWAEYEYEYGIKENSIKSILLLDFVKFVIEEKEEIADSGELV